MDVILTGARYNEDNKIKMMMMVMLLGGAVVAVGLVVFERWLLCL